MPEQRTRCAIYTRKSSEEGLEQSFNSLDAQREACEAFITSQKHEGWSVLPAHYDDGGISGGTMERRALQRLLADIANGKVDVVVVYKVDRLTRSLADFAKIVEAFDAKGVSFVSVTQQFNTTTSMGRLTLNVLLSFAQFEREVAGERIRDKIAASKKKGMWMGGAEPLGYDVKDKALVVNDAEAKTIRHIFTRYAELGSVHLLKSELDRDGYVSKMRVNKYGRSSGGNPFSRGALYLLLQNQLYRGKVPHKGEVHEGLHDAVIDEELWDRVQAQVEKNRANREVGEKAAAPSLLAGLIFDESGDRLTPTHANKKGRRYRYYISHRLISKERGDETQGGVRIAASVLEEIVTSRVIAFLGDSKQIHDVMSARSIGADGRVRFIAAGRALAERWPSLPMAKRREMLRILVSKIAVGRHSVDLSMRADGVVAILVDGAPTLNREPGDDADTIALSIPTRLKRMGRETKLVIDGPGGPSAIPNPTLIKLIAKGQRYRDLLMQGSATSIQELADAEGVSRPYFSSVVRLGFLGPDIINAMVRGEQPTSLTAKWLLKNTALPLDWSDQRAVLGYD